MIKQIITGILVLPFVFAANASKAQTVTLDYFFNLETRVGKNGSTERYHYTWADQGNTGFSKWGELFKRRGAKTDSLVSAPTLSNLKGTDIYIIVDPDTKKESVKPNYVEPAHVQSISKWVKAGGVLVLMANDSANNELPHFNTLAAKFGMHFNNDMQAHVADDNHFEDGAIVPPNKDVFKTAKKLFMKDACSISLTGVAKPLLKTSNGAIIAALAKYGKGTVIAVGDPWLYNEYVNGRLPAEFDNDKAADDLAAYLLNIVNR